jgi:ribosomal protein S18 acetylase RimI-like enzyme
MSSSEALFLIQALSKAQDKSVFSCGVEALDRYLKQQASQDIKRHLAQIFVAVPKETPQTIAGFYTLSATSMHEDLARKFPRYPLPAALIGRLAVAEYFQRQGLGKILLADALKRIVAARQSIGMFAAIVDAKEEKAKQFYIKFGFTAFHDQPLRLFLPLEPETVRK